MESRRSARDRSRCPKAKAPPEQLSGRKMKPAVKKITTNVKDVSPLLVDATGDDDDEEVDATGDDGDEEVDATGDDGDKEVDATGNDGDEEVDAATDDDGDKQVDAIGDDGDKQVDATDDVDNRFVCTSVNHRGPCGWKIAHECIGEDNDIPIQCKGNLNESCLCLVHPECMLLWDCSSSAITPVDAFSRFNLVCPMHHPH